MRKKTNAITNDEQIGNLPIFEIHLVDFTKFNQGEEIITVMSDEYDLAVGEKYYWRYGEREGVLEVVLRHGSFCGIKKIS